MVELAVLTAIVVILQLTGVAIRIPFLGTPVSLVLIPITLGAMLMGPWAGAFLGFVFGVIVYVTGGVMGMNAFTAFLFNDHPVITAGICLVKSTLAGFLAGIVFRAIEKKNSLAATVTAAAITPVVNTGVFVLGCLLILNTIEGFIASAGLGVSGVYFIFIGCAGINFVFEFLVNMIFATALHRVYKAVLAKVKA
jgi:uncharacterized membrane protein